MKTSKKGFTLTEIIIVVAIIVIISGAAIAGIAVTVKNAGERGEQIAELHCDNWESGAKQNIKDNVPTLGADTVYEESLDTPTPEPESGNPGGEGGSGDEDDGSSTGGGSTDGGSTSGGSTDGGSTSGGSTGSDTTTGGGTSSDTTTGGDTISGGSSGSNSGSGAVTVNATGATNVGVKTYTNNSDGTTSLSLAYNNGNESSNVKIRKNSDDTYSLYIVEGNNPIGAVVGYNQQNNWCAQGQWLNLPDDQWAKLESTYGFTLN